VAAHVTGATALWVLTVFLLLQRVTVAQADPASSRTHAATI
jgi:hypothetical protein